LITIRGTFASAIAVGTLSIATLFVPTIRAQSADNLQVANHAISATFHVANNTVDGLVIKDRIHQLNIPIATPFAILLKDGTIYTANNLAVTGAPEKHALTPHPDASRLADRLMGHAIDVPLESADHSLRLEWSLVLLDDSNYLRQVLKITAIDKDLAIQPCPTDRSRASGRSRQWLRRWFADCGRRSLSRIRASALAQRGQTRPCHRMDRSRSALAKWPDHHLLIRDWRSAFRADAPRFSRIH
jgi:hypothetical protein